MDDSARQLQQDARKLAKPFEVLAKAKPGSATYLDDLKKASRKLEDTDAIATATKDLVTRAQTLTQDEEQRLRQMWQAVEAKFIREVRARDIPVREFNESWRVGALEMRMQRPQARVQFLYNREAITRWERIVDADELMGKYDEVIELLERARLEDASLEPVVRRAFEASALATRSEVRRHEKQSVPIREFLTAFRLEILRRHLEAKGPGASVARLPERPMWALLFNLDHYRAMSSSLPPEQRVSFQTGTQSEGSSGACVALNGLNAAADYQVYCYVVGSIA